MISAQAGIDEFRPLHLNGVQKVVSSNLTAPTILLNSFPSQISIPRNVHAGFIRRASEPDK